MSLHFTFNLYFYFCCGVVECITMSLNDPIKKNTMGCQYNI